MKKYFWLLTTVAFLFLGATASLAATPTPTPTGPPMGYYKLILLTHPAQQVTSTSAVISGTVSLGEKVGNPPHQPDIMLSLKYWEASNPTNKMTAVSVFNFYYPRTISATLQNLKPNTVYNFALVSMSTNYGNIESFTTLP